MPTARRGHVFPFAACSRKAVSMAPNRARFPDIVCKKRDRLKSEGELESARGDWRKKFITCLRSPPCKLPACKNSIRTEIPSARFVAARRACAPVVPRKDVGLYVATFGLSTTAPFALDCACLGSRLPGGRFAAPGPRSKPRPGYYAEYSHTTSRTRRRYHAERSVGPRVVPRSRSRWGHSVHRPHAPLLSAASRDAH